MNNIARHPFNHRRKKGGADGHSPESLLASASTLLAEAEALMTACRHLIDQSIHARAQSHDTPEGVVFESDADIGTRERADNGLRQATQPSRTAEEDSSGRINVDVIEILVSRFPDLVRGSIIFLASLMENSGRFVTHSEMLELMGSTSRTILKVHASRVRKSLKDKGIDGPILSVRGGYGLSHDGLKKICAGLNLTPIEMATIDFHFPYLKS